MGATNFSTISIVKGDAHVAYRQAREDANNYNGHQDGYSGDIQTTHGFVLKTSAAPRFGTKAFREWEDEQLNRLQKWGPCAAVEIKGAEFKRLKEQHGLKGRKGYQAFYFFGWAAC